MKLNYKIEVMFKDGVVKSYEAFAYHDNKGYLIIENTQFSQVVLMVSEIRSINILDIKRHEEYNKQISKGGINYV